MEVLGVAVGFVEQILAVAGVVIVVIVDSKGVSVVRWAATEIVQFRVKSSHVVAGILHSPGANSASGLH